MLLKAYIHIFTILMQTNNIIAPESDISDAPVVSVSKPTRRTTTRRVQPVSTSSRNDDTVVISDSQTEQQNNQSSQPVVVKPTSRRRKAPSHPINESSVSLVDQTSSPSDNSIIISGPSDIESSQLSSEPAKNDITSQQVDTYASAAASAAALQRRTKVYHLSSSSKVSTTANQLSLSNDTILHLHLTPRDRSSSTSGSTDSPDPYDSSGNAMNPAPLVGMDTIGHGAAAAAGIDYSPLQNDPTVSTRGYQPCPDHEPFLNTSLLPTEHQISHPSEQEVVRCRTLPLMYDYLDISTRDQWLHRTTQHCHWCCHSFDNPPCALPIKLENGKFHVIGCFCSFPCAAAYNFKEFNDDSKWEHYSYLNMLYKQVYHLERIQSVKIAPPREMLQMFGGPFTITQYRQRVTDNNYSYRVIYPPMLPVVPRLEETLISHQRLYAQQQVKRNVPLNQQQLEKAMTNVQKRKNTKSGTMNLQDYFNFNVS